MTLEQAQAWAILFAAFGAMVTGIIAVWRQNGTVKKVDDVHAAVSMSNGTTLGGTVERIDRNTPTTDAPPTP